MPAQSSIEHKRTWNSDGHIRTLVQVNSNIANFIPLEALRVLSTLKTEAKNDDAKPESSAGDTAKEENKLIVVCSSDRGLCGAINSSLSKIARKMIKEGSGGINVVVVGDKAKPQVARAGRQHIKLVINQVGRNAPTYSDALSIANAILEAEIPHDQTVILYNLFRSVIAYENTVLPVMNMSQIEKAPQRAAYDIKDHIMQNYLEWNLANSVYRALIEGYASEMAARRMAMENATKNSDEIVLALTMKYNRTRQAVITNELVDIITGASAL